jgi:hypothetical protein
MNGRDGVDWAVKKLVVVMLSSSRRHLECAQEDLWAGMHGRGLGEGLGDLI